VARKPASSAVSRPGAWCTSEGGELSPQGGAPVEHGRDRADRDERQRRQPGPQRDPEPPDGRERAPVQPRAQGQQRAQAQAAADRQTEQELPVRHAEGAGRQGHVAAQTRDQPPDAGENGKRALSEAGAAPARVRDRAATSGRTASSAAHSAWWYVLLQSRKRSASTRRCRRGSPRKTAATAACVSWGQSSSPAKHASRQRRSVAWTA
jgi:hypothetical protein